MRPDEIQKVFLQTVINIFETALDPNSGDPTAYGFYKNKIFIDFADPQANEKKRFRILINIESAEKIAGYRRSPAEFIISFKILDFLTKTDKTDKTLLLFTLLDSITDPEYNAFGATAQLMLQANEITQAYVLAKEVTSLKMSHFKDRFGVWNLLKIYKFIVQPTI